MSTRRYNLLKQWPEEEGEFDYLIVGCGLSGAVVAEKIASEWNKKCLIIDKRDHIGGNCYDYHNEYGILMNKYGPHLFHTNYERVWNYVQKYTKWVRWEQQTVGCVDGQYVSIPVNITTVNRLCGESIRTTEEMDDWLAAAQVKYDWEPRNGEEMAKSRVGEFLYEKIFKFYTKKQWDRYPEELDASVLARIPVRNNYDTRYFADKYQALPLYGYTDFFDNLLAHKNISVLLNCNFFDYKEQVDPEIPIIYTGPIDHYFAGCGLPALQYRSLEFKIENLENVGYYQPFGIVNYPGPDVPHTRIVEYKHFLNQSSPHTTIVKEYSNAEGDPYYPVPNDRNTALYNKYKKMTAETKNIHFLGRLANYKYFNMDQAINNALEFFDQLNEDVNIIGPGKD